MTARFPLTGAAAAWLLALVLLPAGAVAQESPSVTIASDSSAAILTALQGEMTAEGFTTVKIQRQKALYSKETGRQSLRGTMVPITLEVTLVLEPAKPGTRVTVREELIADLGPGIQDRRRPHPKDRYAAWMELLTRIKSQIESGAPAPDSASRPPAGN